MADEPAPDPMSMSAGAVDDVLAGIDDATTEFTASSTLEVSDVDEPSVDHGAPEPESPSWPDPLRALRIARRRLADDTRKRRADAAREFAAWWADLASVALVDTAEGRPVQVVRAAAGDPSVELSDEDLLQLPGVSFRADGYVVMDRADPDRRRDQLWGPDWTDHRAPPLPPTAGLSDRLTRLGVPEDRVLAVCQARDAIADALDAGSQPGEPEQIERTERLTGRLVDYARLLTQTLREIWSGTAIR